jgi:hypothetical protein
MKSMHRQTKGSTTMVRSSTLALVALFAVSLSFASVGAASADTGCTGYAREHCEVIAAARDERIVYHIEAASPLHIRPGNGMGQEHFEAMTPGDVAVFSVAPPPVVVSSAQQRFLEANTVTLPAAPSPPYAEDVTPTLGRPR